MVVYMCGRPLVKVKLVTKHIGIEQRFDFDAFLKEMLEIISE